MTIQEVKASITKAIRDKFDMGVKQFADSQHPEKAGISGGSSLRCYLSAGATASTSFLTYKKLYDYLGLGELEREKQVVTTIDYIVKGGAPIVVKRTPPRVPATRATPVPPPKRGTPPRRPQRA